MLSQGLVFCVLRISNRSPHAKLPSPSREKRKTKDLSKRDEFISDSGLNERMNDAGMAEIRLGIREIKTKSGGLEMFVIVKMSRKVIERTKRY